MSAGRRKARREAVFALYRQDLLGEAEHMDLLLENHHAEDYAAQIVSGVGAAQPQIDNLLSQHVRNWSLERIGFLERAILRVATYELFSQPTVPAAVVLDEAVGLAKRYCSAEAGSLINGILGSASKSIRPDDTVPSELRDAAP